MLPCPLFGRVASRAEPSLTPITPSLLFDGRSCRWCADIEKRQEAFRKGDLKPERRKEVVVVPNIGSLGRVFVKTEVGERTVPRGGASDLGVEGMPGALE